MEWPTPSLGGGAILHVFSILREKAGQDGQAVDQPHLPQQQPAAKEGRGPYSAIRSGDLKLIEFFDPPALELYNLQQDPTEQNNLAPQDPATVASLHQKLQAWRTSVQAQLPTPNPDYDPANAGKPAPGPKNTAEKARE